MEIILHLLIIVACSFCFATCDPKAKQVIRAMDRQISDHVAWDDYDKWTSIMAEFFTQDMIYDTNYYDGSNELMGNGTGIKSWYFREHLPINKAFDNQTFSQMIFAADEQTATTTTYAVAPWTKGPFVGVDPPGKIIKYRIFDFYQLKGNKIWYNWMLLDTVHMMYEAGFEVLPRNWNPLRQGYVRPPNAMDGIPAPISRAVDPEDTKNSREIAMRALEHDLLHGPEACRYWKNSMVWYGSYGFGMARGKEEYSFFFVRALNKAFQSRELQLDLMVCEGNYCGAHGYLIGNFTGIFLGELPSHTRTKLRFGLHWHIVNRQIVEGYALFDLPGFFIQSGVNLYERAYQVDNVKIELLHQDVNDIRHPVYHN